MNQLSHFGCELYGFSGKLGTGKNYIAEKLFLSMLPKKNTVVMALADHFKVDCCAKDRVEFSKVFVQKDDQTRVLLQKRGTEEGRMKYGEDIWIRTLGTWIRMYQERGVERIIVTDLRFPNEVQWLMDMGGKSFRIEAPNRNKDKLDQESEGDPEKLKLIAGHASEIALDDYTGFDYIIRNDYEDQDGMPNQIRDIIRELIWKKPQDLVIFCDLDDTICECKKFYKTIIEQVMEIIRAETGISDTVLGELLQKHVLSFERRYFTRDDFGRSLAKLYMDAYLRQELMLEYRHEGADRIYNLGLTVYDYNYDPLYNDSIERVRELSQHGQVVLFTLGDHTEQMKKIAHLGLLDLPIEIFTHKDENMFRYLMNKYPGKEYVMIGDSYHRDIIPAQKAGINHLVLITQTKEIKLDTNSPSLPMGSNGREVDGQEQSKDFDEVSEGGIRSDLAQKIKEEKNVDSIFRIDRLNNKLMKYLQKLTLKH